MPFIQARDQTSLFYTDWETGEPVVFAYPWALNSDMLAYRMPELVVAGLRCVAYDRRGQGPWPVPDVRDERVVQRRVTVASVMGTAAAEDGAKKRLCSQDSVRIRRAGPSWRRDIH